MPNDKMYSGYLEWGAGPRPDRDLKEVLMELEKRAVVVTEQEKEASDRAAEKAAVAKKVLEAKKLKPKEK